MVRSSMISIGAASEPARSSSARSLASTVVIEPEIWKRVPSSAWITGAVNASPLPFSNRMMAMRLRRFSRLTSRMMRPPLASTVRSTLGCCVCESKPGCASVRLSPVRMTWRLTMTGDPSRSRNFSEPKGTGPLLSSAARPSVLSSTRRISSVAVRPRMSLALAVSCTPGSCTTTRSAPCCWITGSATPSSFTRLCSVVMFCLTASFCTACSACGLKVATRRGSPPELSASCRSGWLSVMARRAASSVAASRARISIELPSRLTPP